MKQRAETVRWTAVIIMLVGLLCVPGSATAVEPEASDDTLWAIYYDNPNDPDHTKQLSGTFTRGDFFETLEAELLVQQKRREGFRAAIVAFQDPSVAYNQPDRPSGPIQFVSRISYPTADTQLDVG